MATITPTSEVPIAAGSSAHGTKVHQWTPVTESDTCTAVDDPGSADVSVQFAGGSFGGGSCALQGSNDGTNYVTLKAIDGTDIDPTAAGFFTLRDNVRYIKPGVPSGTSVSLTITVLSKTVR